MSSSKYANAGCRHSFFCCCSNNGIQHNYLFCLSTYSPSVIPFQPFIHSLTKRMVRFVAQFSSYSQKVWARKRTRADLFWNAFRKALFLNFTSDQIKWAYLAEAWAISWWKLRLCCLIQSWESISTHDIKSATFHLSVYRVMRNDTWKRKIRFGFELFCHFREAYGLHVPFLYLLTFGITL